MALAAAAGAPPELPAPACAAAGVDAVLAATPVSSAPPTMPVVLRNVLRSLFMVSSAALLRRRHHRGSSSAARIIDQSPPYSSAAAAWHARAAQGARGRAVPPQLKDGRSRSPSPAPVRSN